MKKRTGNIFFPDQYHGCLNWTWHYCFCTVLIIILSTWFNSKTTGQSKFKSDNDTSKPVTQSREEKLAHDIFEAFQKRSDSLWVLLYPTNAEYRELTRLMTEAKIIKLPQATIDKMLTRHDNEATDAYRKLFHLFLKQADSLNIHWNDAVYRKLDFNSFYPEDFVRKYMSGDIWFTCKNSRFLIEGFEAVEIPPDFRLQSIKAIRRVDSLE